MPENNPVVEVVLKQAKDPKLWFWVSNAGEAYLQKELRRLHGVIEAFFESEFRQAEGQGV